MAKLQPAIFIDRDGTLNIDHGYVHEIDNFQFIEGVIEACKELKAMGYALIVVTNQSGIAQGFFSEDEFMQLTEWMDWSLSDRGVDLDGIYYCPHHPTKGKGDFLCECDCRKPQPGMLLSSQKYLKIDMANSYMVGDKWEDMQAGISAKVGHNILVKTGKPLTDKAALLADTIIESLADLPKLIRETEKIKK